MKNGEKSHEAKKCIVIQADRHKAKMFTMPRGKGRIGV